MTIRLSSILGFFSKKRHQKAREDLDDGAAFSQSYQYFREILENNHQVLRTMGDMQEKALGEFLFDRPYLLSSSERLSSGIEHIIGALNSLSGDRYTDLLVPYRECMAAIQARIDPRIEIPSTPFVLDLQDIGIDDRTAVGGKFAPLGEIARNTGLQVPPGFVITTWAYRTFMEFNHIDDFVRLALDRLDVRDYAALRATTDEIQARVLASTIPPEVAAAIEQGYTRLRGRIDLDPVRVAVRSSALHEDVQASFAGQYSSELNVPAERIGDEYCNILASLFLPRAIFYFKGKEYNLDNLAMAVGVMAQVDAEKSGIAYSRDPAHRWEDRILISAIRGLGPYAVGGIVAPDEYVVSPRESERVRIVESGRQEAMLICKPDGGTCEAVMPSALTSEPALKPQMALDIADAARQLETLFQRPQDIEWAVDAHGSLMVLQSRPLQVPTRGGDHDHKRPASVEGHDLLLDTGTVVCRGAAAGPVHVVRRGQDMARFPQGGVLVIRHCHPEFAPLFERAAAVLSDVGTALGHLATVAREVNLPAIFNTGTGTRVLEEGTMVTVDADYANVYAGVVEELVQRRQSGGSLEVSPIVRQLQDILQHVTPLNLTDPRSPEFTPRGCRTLHDITRFCHEAALKEMFELSKESHFTARSARRLVAEVPLQWWVIDLQDGLTGPQSKKTVRVDQIASIPMQAIWEGMIAKPWQGPPPVDTKGFMSVMMKSMTEPGIDPAVPSPFVDKNYMLVARNFCNVSTRLGFHFSTVESYVAEKADQNYISFVFTGGGGDDGRKGRRVALISRLVELADFRVEVRGESLFARIEGNSAEFTCKRLRVIGHIMVHTRQMDMVMYNDKMVDFYYKDFARAILPYFEPDGEATGAG